MKKVGNCYLLFNLIKACLNGRSIEQKLYGHNNFVKFVMDCCKAQKILALTVGWSL